MTSSTIASVASRLFNRMAAAFAVLLCAMAVLGWFPGAVQAATLDEALVLASTLPVEECWVEVDSNVPSFDPELMVAECFEFYSELDELGRCGAAFACVGPELLPTEPRGSIGMVKPSGWQLAKYDCVEGGYLYNRCHLIAYRLSGQNANELNLITGTRWMNIQGMDPFEDIVYDYVYATGNHVLYRVTPVFEGENLVASGVQMEGLSVEDGGAGVCFNVFVSNRQPGVTIDYANGSNWLEAPGEELVVVEEVVVEAVEVEEHEVAYVLNTNTHKFHQPGCSSVKDMKESNKLLFEGSRDEAIAQGYVPCKRCNP